MRRTGACIAIGLAAITGCSGSPSRQDTAPPGTLIVTIPGPGGAVVTTSSWANLAIGQPLDEVNRIIGGPGVLSETRDGGTLGPVDVYTWTGDAPGCAAGIGFAHGRVVALNWYGRCPWDHTGTTRP